MEQLRSKETAQKADVLEETAVFEAVVLEQLLQDIYGEEAEEKIHQARQYAAMSDRDLTENLRVRLQFPGKRGMCAVCTEVPGKFILIRHFTVMDIRVFSWQNHRMIPKDSTLTQLNLLARFCREMTA